MSKAPLPEESIVWNLHFSSLYDMAVDCDGRRIKKSDYGKLTEYGWEIDHAAPSALGGPNAFHNKRPRHWQGNRSAGGLLANALAKSPLSPPRAAHENDGLANALMQSPFNPRSASPDHSGLANALAQPARHDEPRGLAAVANALYRKPRGLF